MKCWCENSTCEHCHGDGCSNEGTVPCMYVGQICTECAKYMPDEYLIKEGETSGQANS